MVASRGRKETRRMGQIMDAFYRNPVIYLLGAAALGALCIFIGQTTAAAFLFMLLGLMIVLWDAHTDPHIPEAPTLT
jgi:hypothetical protein